jgi:hypothetical protein
MWGVLMKAAILFRACVSAGASLGFLVGLTTAVALADNQTPTVSPVSTDTDSLPYALRLRQREMPRLLPTMQSFTAGQSQGLWVLFGGRTNGMHGFTDDPLQNFPPRYQNRRIWVIDPVSGDRWSRSLNDSSLTRDQVDALASFAAQSVQIGDTLYVVGGYGFSRSLKDFKTYSTMTAFDLGNIIKWVRQEGGLPPGKEDLASLIRQTEDEVLQVTGGQMMMTQGRALLAFGQMFDGGYGSPNFTQVYTTQIRSFRIVDDGTTLGIEDIRRRPTQPNPDDFRRRDYNLIPIIEAGQPSRTATKAVALAGVFTLTDGMFTVPVEISGTGIPTMQDPDAPPSPGAPPVFKQAMNGYNCAVLPIFDGATGENHAVLFGGISYVYYHNGNFIEDSNFPFINDVTAVVRQTDGGYRQVLIGRFPAVRTVDQKRLRFGAEAAVFLKPSTPVTENGMLDLAELKAQHGTRPVHVGWIFGGIAADKPNGGTSVASNLVFDIIVTPR